MEPRRSGMYEEKLFVTVFSFSQVHSKEWELRRAFFLKKKNHLFSCATIMNLLPTWLSTPIFFSFLNYCHKKMRTAIELHFFGEGGKVCYGQFKSGLW